MAKIMSLFGITVGFVGVGRGEMVDAGAGVAGLFVGRKAGVEWVCYDPANFDAMCVAFDRA